MQSGSRLLVSQSTRSRAAPEQELLGHDDEDGDDYSLIWPMIKKKELSEVYSA